MSEDIKTATPLAEFASPPAVPGLYPSPTTYPSAAGTYPSAGSPASGLQVTSVTEGTKTATPLTEV